MTGRKLTELDHLRQSVADILSTPLGSRVMRRSYGSRLHALIDQPMNSSGKMNVYNATVEALAKWEPRLVVTRVVLAAATVSGSFTLDLTGNVNGQRVNIDGVVI